MKKGDKVYAFLSGSVDDYVEPGDEAWYPATIAKVKRDGTYQINWGDDDDGRPYICPASYVIPKGTPFDPTKPVRTFYNYRVRILATDIKDPRAPIVAAVLDPRTGREDVDTYGADGRYSASFMSPEEDPYGGICDLLNPPEGFDQ